MCTKGIDVRVVYKYKTYIELNVPNYIDTFVGLVGSSTDETSKGVYRRSTQE